MRQFTFAKLWPHLFAVFFFVPVVLWVFRGFGVRSRVGMRLLVWFLGCADARGGGAGFFQLSLYGQTVRLFA